MEALTKKVLAPLYKDTVAVGNWWVESMFNDNNYCHIGHEIVLRGPFPFTAESEIVPAEFFPGDHIAKETSIAPPDVLKGWWQHWPWVYRKALDEQL